jgi:hypothetical protein
MLANELVFLIDSFGFLGDGKSKKVVLEQSKIVWQFAPMDILEKGSRFFAW